jgi:hypothetical protein
MRLFLLVLILIFNLQSWTKADNIRDFEIEGMSVGDSLLKMYSDAQIKGWSKTDYKSKKYSRFSMKDTRLETYDDIQFHYLTDVFSDIKKILIDTKTDINEKIHRADKNKQSKKYSMSFNLESGAIIEVTCMDWSDEIFETKGWRDHLRVGVNDEKFLQWIKEEAYQ